MVDVSKLPTVPGKLTPASTSPPVQVSYRQAPSGALLHASGRTILNANATQDLTDLAKAADKPKGKYTILPSANEESGIIAFHIVEPGTLGSVVAKPIDAGKRTSIDLSGLFETFPSLKANLDRSCPAKIMKDEEGTPCLVMAVKGSAIKTPTRRPVSQATPSAQS